MTPPVVYLDAAGTAIGLIGVLLAVYFQLVAPAVRDTHYPSSQILSLFLAGAASMTVYGDVFTPWPLYVKFWSVLIFALLVALTAYNCIDEGRIGR